jgi:flavorubredoxin
MMPFRKIIEKNLKKVQGYEISLIAPSHGPMYDRPEFILEAYRDWVLSDPKNIVVLPYISMHGSTLAMVDYLVDSLVEKGVTVERFDLAATDIGKLAMALVDAATIVIGSPTVLTGAHPNVVYAAYLANALRPKVKFVSIVGAHPNVVYAAYLANALRPKVKFVSIVGSYGWGGKMVQQLAGLIPNLKVEILDPVIVKGHPRDGDFEALDKLAVTIAEKHNALNLQ